MSAPEELIEGSGPPVSLGWHEAVRGLDYVRGTVYESKNHPKMRFLAFRATLPKTLSGDFALIPDGCDLRDGALDQTSLWIESEALEIVGYLNINRLGLRINGYNV